MATWSLFSELESLRREMDETFRGFGFARPLATTFLSPASARRFPLINLSEDGGNIYLEALVPGVDPNQLEVSLLRDTVTIAGERKAPAEKQEDLIHRNELGFGRFSRTIDLPAEIDPAQTSADFRDGVLRITMAKPAHAQPRKIEVSVS